jgi:hypothetical protein
LNAKVNEEIGNAFMAIRGGEVITVGGKTSKRIDVNGKDLKTHLYDLISSKEYKDLPIGVKDIVLEAHVNTFTELAKQELKRMYPEIARAERDALLFQAEEMSSRGRR